MTSDTILERGIVNVHVNCIGGIDGITERFSQYDGDGLPHGFHIFLRQHGVLIRAIDLHNRIDAQPAQVPDIHTSEDRMDAGLCLCGARLAGENAAKGQRASDKMQMKGVLVAYIGDIPALTGDQPGIFAAMNRTADGFLVTVMQATTSN